MTKKLFLKAIAVFNQSLPTESSSAKKGLENVFKRVKNRTRVWNLVNVRIIIVIPDGMRHPLFVGLLLGESSTTRQAENHRKQDEAMQCSRDYERQPHAEVIYLSNGLFNTNLRGQMHVLTSRSLE